MQKLIATLMIGCSFSIGCVDEPEAVYAEAPPPDGRAEVMTVSPSADQVWIGGYYHYIGRTYVWVPGQWIARPTPQAVYTPGSWQRRGRHWVFIEGGWS